jgi:hypothetical protein
MSCDALILEAKGSYILLAWMKVLNFVVIKKEIQFFDNHCLAH